MKAPIIILGYTFLKHNFQKFKLLWCKKVLQESLSIHNLKSCYELYSVANIIDQKKSFSWFWIELVFGIYLIVAQGLQRNF